MDTNKKHILSDITIEITSKCSLKCKICSTNAHCNISEHLPFSLLKNLINDLNVMGCRTLNISGGEPFHYPHFTKLCQFLTKFDFNVQFYSCGNYSDLKNNTRSLPLKKLRLLSNIKNAKIIFSLHGIDEEIHERTTLVPGSFQNLIISYFSAQKFSIPTEFHFVPTQINIHQISLLNHFALKNKISKIRLLRFVPQGRGAENKKELQLTRIFHDQIKKILRKSDRISTGAHFSFLTPNQPINCTAGTEKAAITSKGIVVPCSSMKGITIFTSDLSLFHYSIQEIWKNSHLFFGDNRCRNYSSCQIFFIKGEFLLWMRKG